MKDKICGVARRLPALLAATLLVGLTLCADEAANGTRDGLTLSFRTALPALFPFFVAGALTCRTGLAADLGRVMQAPMRRLFGLPGEAAAALLLGLLGGYPTGAQAAARLYRSGALTRTECERLLTFANCSGPAFLVGVCGVAICGSVQTGLLLYAIHVAAALLTGLALASAPRKSTLQARLTASPQREAFAPAFVGAIGDAAAVAMTVTAFIAFFSALLALLRALSLDTLWQTMLSPILGFLGVPEEAQAAASVGMLELTNGLSGLMGLDLPAQHLVPLLSLLTALGGLSVLGQTAALLTGTGLSLKPCVLGKLTHALLAWGLAEILCTACPSALPVFAVSEAVRTSANGAALGFSVLIPLLLVLFERGRARR